MLNMFKRIPALLLAVALLFTCVYAEGDDTVVATYNGREVKASEVNELVNTEINLMVTNMNYLYQMTGKGTYSVTDEDKMYIREGVVEAYIKQQIVIDKLSEYGLSDLTEEEKAALRSEAEYTFTAYAYSYNQQYGYSYDQCAYLLAAQGITLNAIYEQAYYNMINSRLADALEVSGDVTDEEITAKYDALVASAEKNYTAAPANVENAVNGGNSAYFMPEGAKYIKHIILIPEDEELMTRYQDALSKLATYENELATITASTYQPKYEAYVEKAILDECKENIELTNATIEEIKLELIASVQGDLNKIQADLDAGETFDQLIETYSDDPGSKAEPIKSNGYLVHKDSNTWDAAFKNAAVALENVGDISEPSVGTLGVYIVKYEKEAAAGAIDFEEVKQDVIDSIMKERKNEEFKTLSQKWYDEANVQMNLENWK